VYYTVTKHCGHLRKLEKCGKHSPAARVFYISLVFSSGRRVLSQSNTRLRLLYMLSKTWVFDQSERAQGSIYIINSDKIWVFDQSERAQGPFYIINSVKTGVLTNQSALEA